MDTNIYQIISRAEAIKQGLKYYYTGEPCKRGHLALRRASTNRCLECDKHKTKQWCMNNIGYSKKYYNTNIERAKEYSKKWRIENSERAKQKGKEWRSKNPDKVIEHGRIRNAHLHSAMTNWPGESELIKQLYLKRDELNALWGTDFVVDHVVPICPKNRSVCGLHTWNNLQLLDKSLNCIKSDSYQTDW